MSQPHIWWQCCQHDDFTFRFKPVMMNLSNNNWYRLSLIIDFIDRIIYIPTYRIYFVYYEHPFIWYITFFTKKINIPRMGFTDTSSSFTTFRVAVLILNNQKLNRLYASLNYIWVRNVLIAEHSHGTPSKPTHAYYMKFPWSRRCCSRVLLARRVLILKSCQKNETKCKFCGKQLCQKFVEEF